MINKAQIIFNHWFYSHNKLLCQLLHDINEIPGINRFLEYIGDPYFWVPKPAKELPLFVIANGVYGFVKYGLPNKFIPILDISIGS